MALQMPLFQVSGARVEAGVPAPVLLPGVRSSFDAAFSSLQRHPLDGEAWVEHAPGWLLGEATLFDTLASRTHWRVERRWMYDREVFVPRLIARAPADTPDVPLLGAMGMALAARYGLALRGASLAFYRDGRDSVAFHGDRGEAAVPGALTASVSLGWPRRMLMRPAAGGRSMPFELGRGDLFVMGGTCQRSWQHAIPKVAHAGPRIAVLYWLAPRRSGAQPPR
jgi:alkylated DNA repair dioxygenase AlkB